MGYRPVLLVGSSQVVETSRGTERGVAVRVHYATYQQNSPPNRRDACVIRRSCVSTTFSSLFLLSRLLSPLVRYTTRGESDSSFVYSVSSIGF